MINCDDYITDGVVERERIALDIKRGLISNDDITTIIHDDRINKSFIGTDFKKKKPQSDWNQEYLDRLSYCAIAEAFNEDYLRNLYEVSRKVNNSKNNKPFIIGGVIILLTALISIIILLFNGKSNSTNNADVSADTLYNANTDFEVLQ